MSYMSIKRFLVQACQFEPPAGNHSSQTHSITAHRTQKHSISAHRTQKHSIAAHRTQNSCSAGHRNTGLLLSEHRIAALSTAHSPHRYCFSTAPPLPTVRQHNNDVLLIQCIAKSQFSHYSLATHNFPRAGWHDNSLVYIYICMCVHI